MKRTTFIFLFFFLVVIAMEILLYNIGKQKKEYVPTYNERDYYSKIQPIASENYYYFWDTGEEINDANQAVNKFLSGGFLPYQGSLGEHHHPDILWIYLNQPFRAGGLSSKAPDLLCTRSDSLRHGSFNDLELYMVETRKAMLIAKTGRDCNLQSKSPNVWFSNRCMSIKEINKTTDLSFLIKISSATEFPTTIFNYFSLLDTEQEERIKRRESERPDQIFIIVFASILLNFFIYTLFQFFQTKERAYFWYSIYLGGLIIYHTEHLEWSFEASWIFDYVVRWHYYYEVPLVVVIYLTYILFVDEFLNLKKFNPRVHQILISAAYCILLLPLVDLFIRWIWGTHVSMLAYNVYRIPLFLTSAYLFYIAFTMMPTGQSKRDLKHKILYNYVMLGALALIIGGLITISLKFLNHTGILEEMGFWGHKLHYTRFGILLENIFFMSGLAYKARLDEAERAGYEERIRNFEERMQDLRNQATRARIPHHTTTNIIASITELFKNGQVDEVKRYSAMLLNISRKLYDQISKKYISLEEELTTIEDYVTLRSLTIKDGIAFIKKYNGIDFSFYPIHPGMLFPLVENAIDHGLIKAHNEKELEIEIQENKEENLIISISDNGIGRQAASSEEQGHKATSTGLMSVEEICRQEGIDLSIADKLPRGTTIILQFKYEKNW